MPRIRPSSGPPVSDQARKRRAKKAGRQIAAAQKQAAQLQQAEMLKKQQQAAVRREKAQTEYVEDFHAAVVVAAVVVRGDVAPTLAEIQGWVADSLDRTAAPRQLHVVEELPRRGIGKLDRAALRAQFG